MRTTTRIFEISTRSAIVFALAVAALGRPPAAAALQPTSQPPGAPGWQTNCGWILTAQSPMGVTHQGNTASIIPTAGMLMIMLSDDDPAPKGGGMLMILGFNGVGTYPIAGGQAGGQSHAQLTVEPQTGGVRTLLTADGSGARDHNYNVFATYPPPARLTITMATVQEIRGDLTGVVYDMAALADVPPRMVYVPVNLIFSARDPSNSQACKGPARIPL